MIMSEQLTEGERTVLEELVNLNQRIPTADLANSLNQGEERVLSIPVNTYVSVYRLDKTIYFLSLQ